MAKRKSRKKVSRKVSRVSPSVAAAAVPRAKPEPIHSSELFKHIAPSKSRAIVVGTWMLIIAVLASVVLALISTPYLALILVAVGFIVGFMNFEHEETVKFLLATVSMLIIASAILLTGFSRLEIVAPVVAMYLRRAAYNVVSVVAPAAFVLSLKALKELTE